MKNYVPNPQYYPNIPYGSYKVELRFNNKNKTVLVLYIFAKVF